jgi:hypothetical protein
MQRDAARWRIIGAAAAVVLLLLFAPASAVSVAIAPGNSVYQYQVPVLFSPSHLLNQLVAGLRVLLLDSWREESLKSDAVPERALVTLDGYCARLHWSDRGVRSERRAQWHAATEYKNPGESAW